MILTEIIEGPDLVVKQPNEILDQMDEWNQEHHKKSGLIDEVKRSVITQEDAEAMITDAIAALEKIADELDQLETKAREQGVPFWD